MSPALVTVDSIASNATLEESTLFSAILGKYLTFKCFAVISASRGVEGAVKEVAGLVPHRLDLLVHVALLVL